MTRLPRSCADPPPSAGRPRIIDVAALAEVSPGTVSNTLNHPERVNAETRDRVMAAIDQLGFVRNQQARILTGARKLVGTADEVATQLSERIAHVSAKNVAFFPLCLGNTYDHYEDQVRRIAQDVLPNVVS